MSGAVEGVALLPCPFCGGEAKYEWHSHPDCWIECTKCGAVGPNSEDTTTEQNAAAWNTRTTPPARPYADGVAGILRTAQADCGCRIPSPFDEVAEHAIGLALATVSQGGKA